MNLHGVLYMLGRLLLALAVAMVLPAGVAYAHAGPDLSAFVISIAVVGGAGLTLGLVFRQPAGFAFGRNEAFVLVTLCWLAASVVAGLPWVVFKGPTFAVDALFEGAAGFTTTGASILSDIEGQPAGLLLWRSLTQWLGGMGIIVLGIAILPKLNRGGVDLLSAEAPGPIQEKLTPRIARTAKALWGIYALFTLTEGLALWAAGMTPLEAINHAFTTMSTGGFSTKNGGIGDFHSSLIEMIITVFMVVAGANFALYFYLLRGKTGPIRKDPEVRLYLLIVLGVTLAIATDLVIWGQGLLDSLRLAVFQTASVQTTTGFATADYDGWPPFSRGALFVLMFIGGCAGSTSGSVKVVRVQILLKKLLADLRRLVQPHAVIPVRMGDRVIPEEVVTAVTTFLHLFVLLFVLGGLSLAAMGVDPLTAFSASAACLANVGPGFGGVGPAKNFAELKVPAKLILTVLMIVGRLELYTVLVLPLLLRRVRRPKRVVLPGKLGRFTPPKKQKEPEPFIPSKTQPWSSGRYGKMVDPNLLQSSSMEIVPEGAEPSDTTQRLAQPELPTRDVQPALPTEAQTTQRLPEPELPEKQADPPEEAPGDA